MTTRLLRQAEAAELLDVSPRTLESWRVRGAPKLPFIKLGHQIRYSEAELARFIEASRRQSTGGDGGP